MPSTTIEKLNNREMEGRPLRVHFSNSDEDRGASRPRSGGGGGSFQRKPFGSR